MIVLKTGRELALMKEACQISAEALQRVGEAVKEGISTKELDDIAFSFIKKSGAIPSFLNYNGFPASACISINDEVIHGIPNKNRILKEGDIVKIDLGAYKNGYHGDNAATFGVGKISDEAQKIIDVTKKSLELAIEAAKPFARIGDIGATVQEYVEQNGFSVVRDYVGHGVGTNLHEDPSVPNYGKHGRGIRLMPGMTIAIEPMVNCGTHSVKLLNDDWTVKTADGRLSAHFEHTIALTEDGAVVLTKV